MEDVLYYFLALLGVWLCIRGIKATFSKKGAEKIVEGNTYGNKAFKKLYTKGERIKMLRRFHGPLSLFLGVILVSFSVMMLTI